MFKKPNWNTGGVLWLTITDLCQSYFSYSQGEGLQIRTDENTAENKLAIYVPSLMLLFQSEWFSSLDLGLVK